MKKSIFYFKKQISLYLVSCTLFLIPCTLYLVSCTLFLLTSCSSPTSTPKGNLSGTVHLEGETEHSNITVAIYDLAELDPDIVSINQEYPHIGVIISQHTEFDHRLQTPVKYTETDAAGNFEIKKIPTGTYNIVALKDSFGFKYIYEFEVEEGNNALTPQSSSRMLSGLRPDRPTPLFNPIEGEHKEVPLLPVRRSLGVGGKGELIYPVESLYSTGKGVNLDRRGSDFTLYPHQNRTSDLTLFPEQHISGDWIEDVSVEPWHHLVIDDDTNFVPGTSLTLGPNAIIRINPGCDLKIYGEIYAQGEENNMFWVTSNSGFAAEVRSDKGKETSLFTSHISLRNADISLFSRDEIALYNSLELSSYATVSDDLISWGKFDYANNCLNNQVNNLHMQNGIFRNGNCGFKSTNVDSTFCEKLLTSNISSYEHAGIYYYITFKGLIKNSMTLNSENGIKLKDKCDVIVKNNYSLRNSFGIKLWQCMGTIQNNEFKNNTTCDIGFTGNQEIETDDLLIELNNFYSIYAIKQFQELSYAYANYTDIYINNNNFIDNDWFIYLTHTNLSNDVLSDYDYFDGLVEIELIKNRINDYYNDEELAEVIISNVDCQINSNAGIK